MIEENFMITSELYKPGTKLLSASNLSAAFTGKMAREGSSDRSSENPVKKRILLIQEVMAILDVNTYILEAKGYDVVCARDGSMGIELFDEAQHQGLPFDVVMVDLYMHRCPGGPETIRRLREIDPEVRMIAFIDFFDAKTRTFFPENAFSGVLQKPYRIQELYDAVSRVISGTKLHPL